MMPFLSSLLLISVVVFPGLAVQAPLAQPAGNTTPSGNPAGRWQVKFVLAGIGEKHLVIESQPKGAASFLLMDAGPDDKPAPGTVPAVWSQTTENRVNFSGEVELPFGTCCREIGTLILKGKFGSANSITGKAIFVASTTDEENFNGFRSTIGTFTATRSP
jgi:hypothetical protein